MYFFGAINLLNMRPFLILLLIIIYLSAFTQKSIYISSKNDNSIIRYDIDTKKQIRIIALENIADSELDEGMQYLFWLDKGNKKIVRFDIQNNTQTNVLTSLGEPQGIFLDKQRKKIFFSDLSGSISYVNYDGSGRRTLVNNLSDITHFVMDFRDSTVYYISQSKNNLIKTDFNGKNPKVLFTKAFGVTHMVIDTTGKKIYWSQKTSSGSTSGLKSTDYSGNQVNGVIDGLFGHFDIDFKSKTIYASLIYGDIFSYNLDGSAKTNIITGNISYLNFNSVTNTILYFDYKAEELLFELNPVNKQIKLLTTRECRQPQSIRLDTMTKKIYFVNESEGQDNVDEGSIVKSEINGKNHNFLIINDPLWIRDPITIEIYSPDNKIYWADKKLKSIFYSDLDGKNPKKIYNTSFFWPGTMKIDQKNLSLYWSDYYKGILKSNLLGLEVAILYKPAPLEHIKSIEVIGDNLYWLENIKYSLKRSDLTGKNIEELLSKSDFTSEPTGLAKLDSITLLISVPGEDKIMRYDISKDTLTNFLEFQNGFSPFDMQVIETGYFPLDFDGDGFFESQDCDDSDITFNPDAEDIWYNETDENCDGTFDPYLDFDNDGYLTNVDCDDNNELVNPGAVEIPYDGLDNDCDSLTLDDDLDRDGFNIDTDCNDNDPSIYPGAPEILDNGIDEDCNGKDQKTKTFEINNIKISVYPNPAYEVIYIETDLNFIASLYSIDGYRMLHELNPEKLSLDKIPTGIYLLEITDKSTNQKVVEKIMVRR